MKKILFLLIMAISPLFGTDDIPTPTPSLLTQTRTLSFSSGYIDKHNTNRSIGEFINESISVYSFLYEGIEHMLGLEVGPATFFYDITLNAQYIIGLIIPSFNGILSEQLHVPYHEFGHFSRCRAYGGNPEFEDKNSRKYNNFFSFFGNYFGTIFQKPSSGATSEIKAQVHQNTNFKNTDQTFLLNAAGLNNQTKLSENMIDHAYLNGIHPCTLGIYLKGKFNILSYIHVENLDSDTKRENERTTSGDISHILSFYQTSNRNIDVKDIKYAAYLSLWTSGSLYSYLWSVAKLQTDRSYKMRPFELFGIRMPDTSTYLMPQGICYKVSSGYRYDDTLTFPISFEFSAKGIQAYEGQIGVHKKFPQWNNSSIEANLLMSHEGEMGGKIYATYSPIDYLYIGAGMEIYNSKTLYGARNTPKDDHYAQEFWIQMGIRY